VSLIADALKAAQWERSGADAASRRHKAAADLVRTRLPGPTPASRIPLPRTGMASSTRVALGVLVLAVAAAGALVVHGRSARVAGTAAGIGAGSEAAGRSQRELAEALLGSGAPAAERGAAGLVASAAAAEVGELEEPAVLTHPAGGGAYGDFVEDPVVAAAGPVKDGAGARGPAAPALTPVAGASPPETRAVAPPADAFQLTLSPARAEGTDFRDAVAAQGSGDHRAAVELYLRLLQRQPIHARAANNLGTSYQALGELELARQAYRRALEIDPAYAAGWSNLAGVLAALGEPEEARAALAESIRIDPTNRAAKVNLANQYAASGGHAEARRLLEEVIRTDPSMAEAHYALARVLEAAGDPGAIDAYRRFLRTAGDHFPALLGPVRERIAQLEKGR
jgi:tetratricopeptide (TPR) repeat protein